MNSFKLSRRLVAIAVVLALLLVLATTSLASAASAKPQDVLPPVSCILVTPTTQVVGVGFIAKLTISVVACPLPPQPFPQANVVVRWGDGSVSTYIYCLEVCHASISASHTYTVIGDYYPSICLVVPASTSPAPCTSVEIKVLPIPAA